MPRGYGVEEARRRAWRTIAGPLATNGLIAPEASFLSYFDAGNFLWQPELAKYRAVKVGISSLGSALLRSWIQ